jgi:hypothetical protein
MTLNKNGDMYNSINYDFQHIFNTFDVNNRLLCTFIALEGLDGLINEVSKTYDIMYNKIFVLHVNNTGEYVITYNIDQGNISVIPQNTILVHRKKESNTLYTINALNELIKSLNKGVLDSSYRINWLEYKNSILLTQHNELKTLNTKIHKIIELS